MQVPEARGFEQVLRGYSNASREREGGVVDDLLVEKNREWAFWEGGGRESYSQPDSGKGFILSAGTLSNTPFRPQPNTGADV